VTAEALAERVRQAGHPSVEYVSNIGRAVEAVLAALEPGDAVLTLGAGNVWQAGDQILSRLTETPAGRETGRGRDAETASAAANRRPSRRGETSE
jgi:hypothetical protein